MTSMRDKVRRFAAASVVIITAACSTDTARPFATEPAAPAQAKLSTREFAPSSTDATTAASVKVLGRKNALTSDLSASAVIDEQGGTIRIPETGFSLYVPMGALSKKTRITVTAMAGSGTAYHFEPHGLVFNLPVWFTQDTKFTESVSGLTLRGAYFKDDAQVDNHKKSATVDAVYQVNLDAFGMILFGVHHFSGYLVSCA